MSERDYAPPLDQLLRLGETSLGVEWHDYRALGIGPEHVPELIRMATDADLVLMADEEDADEAPSWAPEHALRALGQLGAVEAAWPLLEGIDRLVDVHDFWAEELGDVLARLGPGVLPSCERYLGDAARPPRNRMVVSEAIPKIVQEHPEQRGPCIEILARQLDRRDDHDPSLNGFILSSLLDLKAVEAAPTIEAAFDAGVIDPMIAGDWPEVRYDLGLGPKPESRRIVERRMAAMRPDGPPSHTRPDLGKLKKRQKQARKQQRKRRK